MSRSRTIRLGVIADTHGLFDPAILRHFHQVDHIIHAGDIGKLSVIEQLKTIAPVTAVSGNVDGYEKSGFPIEALIELNGFRIAIRHVQRGEGDPYAILGLERGVSFDTARSRYRSLVKQHHPDRLVAEGLPLEFIAIANARLAAINAAWASIEKHLEAA